STSTHGSGSIVLMPPEPAGSILWLGLVSTPGGVTGTLGVGVTPLGVVGVPGVRGSGTTTVPPGGGVVLLVVVVVVATGFPLCPVGGEFDSEHAATTRAVNQRRKPATRGFCSERWEKAEEFLAIEGRPSREC